MKCNSCKSAMLTTKREATDRVTTDWLECPLCGSVRMTTSHKDIHSRELNQNTYPDGPIQPLRNKRVYA